MHNVVLSFSQLMDAVLTATCPHHPVSDAATLRAGLHTLQAWLDRHKHAPPPRVITIARSAVDGYTSPSVVEFLEQHTLQLVQAAFPTSTRG